MDDDHSLSEQFIELSMPCTECIVAAICKDKPRSILKKDDIFPFVLAMRKFDEKKKIYRKGLIECWANMGWRLVSNMRTSEYKQFPKNVAPEFVDVLIELSNTIQYIINSKSWRDGEKHDFDKSEIALRIKKALTWV